MPASKKPAAEAVPAPTLTANHAAAIFAVGIVVIAGLLVALMREVAPKPAAAPTPAADTAFAALSVDAQFRAWIIAWQSVDPYVTPAEFMLRTSGPIVPARPDEAVPAEALAAPRTARYVWSPNRARFADYLVSYGEPDSAVAVYGRRGAGTFETLAFCGTPCRFDGAFWLDDNRLAIVGSEESLQADGRERCIGEGDDRRCFRRLTVTIYDFAADAQRTYVSGDHHFPANPFDAAHRALWEKSVETP